MQQLKLFGFLLMIVLTHFGFIINVAFAFVMAEIFNAIKTNTPMLPPEEADIESKLLQKCVISKNKPIILI